MRLDQKTIDMVCEGPVHLLGNNDGMVIGNSQALVKDLKEAVEILRELVKRQSVNGTEIVRGKAYQWLKVQ